MQRAEEKPGMVQERTGERLNQGVCGRRVALVRVGNELWSPGSFQTQGGSA